MKKLISFVFTILFVAGCFDSYASAETIQDSELRSDLVQRVSVTSGVGNEVVPFRIESVSVKNIQENQYTASCEVFIPIPEFGIKPSSTISGGREDNGITADLEVTYFLNKTTGDIKLSAVSGGWSGTLANLEITDREVMLTDGVLFFGKSETWHPTTNTFNYETGWDYSTYVPNDTTVGTGPRTYSEAYYRIPGMGGWDWRSILVSFDIVPNI